MSFTQYFIILDLRCILKGTRPSSPYRPHRFVDFFHIKCNMYVVYLFLYFVYLVSADPDIGEIDGK